MKLTLDNLHMYCDEEGECLLWKLSLNQKSHPQARLEGRTQLVRRYVYLTLMGRRLPAKHHVSVRCGNPLCIAPECLVARTQSLSVKLSYANGRRCMTAEYAGRLDRIEKQGWTKLTREAVDLIRASKEPHTVLAERFNVHRKTIAAARSGRYWRLPAANSVFNLKDAA